MKKIIKIVILILIIVGAISVWYFYIFRSRIQPTVRPAPPVACTQLVKTCPDGSVVGLNGPNCNDFEACPIHLQIPSDWLTFNDTTQGISFRYPKSLNAKYIYTNQWPPKITLFSRGTIACVSSAANYVTPKTDTVDGKIISNRHYCVETHSEGAAGSTYVTLHYSTDQNVFDDKYNKGVTIHFVLQYPQCANYPDLQMTECQKERNTFDVDNLVEQIVQSIKMN